MKVWVTRAEPGASATAARLRALDYEPLVAPLLGIRPLPAPELPREGVGALAFTSRNGVAAASGILPEAWRALPVFAVGEATACAAREAGFRRVRSADGDMRALETLISAHRAEIDGPVLHLGAREPAGVLRATGVPVVAVAVYEAVELGTPPAVTAGWSELDAALVHSPRAARAFATATAALDRSRLIVACISPAAAASLRSLFADVRIAEAPNEAALLARLGKAVSAV